MKAKKIVYLMLIYREVCQTQTISKSTLEEGELKDGSCSSNRSNQFNTYN